VSRQVGEQWSYYFLSVIPSQRAKRKPCKVLITYAIENMLECKSNACIEVYAVLSRKHLMSAWVCFHILFRNIKVASLELYVVPHLKGLGAL